MLSIIFHISRSSQPKISVCLSILPDCSFPRAPHGCSYSGMCLQKTSLTALHVHSASDPVFVPSALSHTNLVNTLLYISPTRV